ncbi:MAG: hypothetical protein EBZ68_07005, partial [Actinobacteria bacterium]|nr:hypothetical protein [Actinomycetota bacterium]
RANGPAGIAALGFGTQRIAPVRKIVGPGSPAVTAAQVEMQRHGVSTMMVLGPTEAMMVADDSTDARRAALDLLIEAEHGEDSTVVLVATDRSVVDDIDAHLARFISTLPPQRATAARAALGTKPCLRATTGLLGRRFLAESTASAVVHRTRRRNRDRRGRVVRLA